MTSQGIYTLANDVVYDQLVALLNSIEKNVGEKLPIYIIPFDDRLTGVKREVANRSNVELFDDPKAIDRWENFAQAVWDAHPDAQKKHLSRPPWGKGHHRKFIAFEGPLAQFVYYDADSLAMKPLDALFEQLDAHDFVYDDWEHRKPDATAALNISTITDTQVYSIDQIRRQLHCSSFFGSKSGIFAPEELGNLQHKLIQDQEITWVSRWWDDAFLFNYLTLRCDRSFYNFTQSTDSRDRTGNCADADPFINIDNVLYNEQGQKPIHRIHYMNYPSVDFTRLSQGEDVKIRYQDIFLYYRFMKDPEKKPQELQPPNFLTKGSRKLQELSKKFQKSLKK